MRKLLFLLCLFGPSQFCYAQNLSSCDTEPVYALSDTTDIPWYGNNEMLYRMLENYPEMLISPNAIRSGNGCDPINKALVIPVKFWIWLDVGENASDVVAIDQIQTLLDRVNEGFQSNGLNFRFYQSCPPDFIIDPDKVSFGSDIEFDNLNNNGAHLSDAINIHVVDENENSSTWGGRYGGPLNDFIGLRRNRFLPENNGTTIIHELGHYFNLEHPHLWTENPACCIREPVTRDKAWHIPCIGCLELIGTWYDRRCSRTGDMLCDTPADPLGNAQFDQYNEPYAPDTRNYMSVYSSRSRFSNGQKAIMIDNILTKNNRSFILEANASLNAKPDDFEPDNTAIIEDPRLIELDELQCHTMQNAFVFGDQDCADLRDWLRIENEQGMLGGYRFIIQDVPGEINPVESVVIHNTDNNGQRTNAFMLNETMNGTERIWEIPCGLMMPNTNATNPNEYNDFLVEIIRDEQLADGFYRAKLERNIDKLPRMTDREQVCLGSIFNITTLPEGATVTWSADNMTLSNTTGASTTISSISVISPYEISALIELDGCTYELSDQFTEVASSTLPEIGSITMDVSGNPCEPQFTFTTDQVTGGTHYDWQCAGSVSGGTFYGCYGDVVHHTNGLAYTHANAFSESGGDFIVNVTLSVGNDCGAGVTKYKGFLYRPDNGCNTNHGTIRSVSITPNPVSTGFFTLEIDDDTINPAPYQIAILSQFGNIEYMINSTDKIHQINSINFANGLYYAQVVSNIDLVTTTFYIQH